MAKLVSEIPRVCQNAVKKMLKNGVFGAEWEQVGVQVGPKSGASAQGEPVQTGRFEGLLWFGGGIVPLGWRSAKYGDF